MSCRAYEFRLCIEFSLSTTADFTAIEMSLRGFSGVVQIALSQPSLGAITTQQTGWLNNEIHLFLTSLETEKTWHLVRTCILAIQCLFVVSLCGGEGGAEASSIRMLIPFVTWQGSYFLLLSQSMSVVSCECHRSTNIQPGAALLEHTWCFGHPDL